MKKSFVLAAIMALLHPCMTRAQHTPYVETVQQAETEGISMKHLDSLYQSAVHVDSTKAVFKHAGADSLIAAYTEYLIGFGAYLSDHNFKWAQPTTCWNRIYFGSDGTVEYYLFNFRTDLSQEQTKAYKELFAAYAQTHKLGISAAVKFAQCSPITYMDK